MNDALSMLPPFAVGLLLGAVFFGGLWWTIRQMLVSPHPALLLVVSAVARMSVVVTGFYFTANGQWQRLLACLVGFIIARLAVTWLTRLKQKEEKHAPES